MESKAFEQWYREWSEQEWPEPADRLRNGWVLAAVRAHMRWGEGREVSRAEFDAAVSEVRGLPVGGAPAPQPPPPTQH